MSEPTTAPPAAPPTSPGRPPPGYGAPLSRLAVAALICAVIGVFLPVVAGLAGIILGWVALRRIRASQGNLKGRGIAQAGMWVGAGGMITSGLLAAFILWGAFAAFSTARVVERSQALNNIYSAAGGWARRQGSYPRHVALMALPDSPVQLPVHQRVGDDPSGGSIVTGEVGAGDFDFARYDGTEASVAAARSAIDGVDLSPGWYRFGNTYFMALPKPTGRADVVFAWSPGPDGTIIAVMDDGSPGFGRTWQAFWDEYAAAAGAAVPGFQRPPPPP